MTADRDHGARNRALADTAVALVERCDRHDVAARIFGSVGVYFRCPGRQEFIDHVRRPLSDIDVVTAPEWSNAIARLLLDGGYQENENWRLLHGYQRRVFYSPANITIELYIGDLRLAQTVHLRDRLTIDHPTISLTDLLLTRVQKVDLTQDDVIDVCALLLEHDFGTTASSSFDVDYISHLAGRSWAWWKAWQVSLDQLERGAQQVLQRRGDCAIVLAKLEMLRVRLFSIPKSPAWHLRALLGDRLRWYQEVEVP